MPEPGIPSASSGAKEPAAAALLADSQAAIPSMAPADRDRVTAALCVYDGVKRDSLKFDFEGHAVSLRYDSMRVAKKNLEMAVAALGLMANGVTPQSLGGAQAAPSKR